MNRKLTGAARSLAVALAVLIAAMACTDADPAAPTATEALSPQGLTSSLDGSADNDANRENDRPHVNILIDGRDVELEFVNPTPFAWSFDYRVDGEPEGTPDQWTDQTISQGPLEGQKFGLRYFPVTLIGEGEETVTVTPEEQVEVRLARGAEQNWYFDWIIVQIPCIVDVLRFNEDTDENDVVESFNSIQDAADFAEPGDTLLVEGTCEGATIRTNDLTITSSQIDQINDELGDPGVIVTRDRGQETLTGASNFDAAEGFEWAATVEGTLDINANGITVSGLEITSSNFGVVIFNFRNGVELTRNFIHDHSSIGIDLRGNNDAVSIHRNWIGGTGSTGVLFHSRGGQIVDIHRNTIRNIDQTTAGAPRGIDVQAGTATVHRNWVTGHRFEDIRTRTGSAVEVHRNLMDACRADGDNRDGWHRNDPESCDR
jgi:hypothetical protein